MNTHNCKGAAEIQESQYSTLSEPTNEHSLTTKKNQGKKEVKKLQMPISLHTYICILLKTLCFFPFCSLKRDEESTDDELKLCEEGTDNTW